MRRVCRASDFSECLDTPLTIQVIYYVWMRSKPHQGNVSLLVRCQLDPEPKDPGPARSNSSGVLLGCSTCNSSRSIYAAGIYAARSTARVNPPEIRKDAEIGLKPYITSSS